MDRLKKLILEALIKPTKKTCSCGCNSCHKAPILNENKQYDYAISVNMRYHIDNKIPLKENKFAIGSPCYNKFIKEAKILVKKGIIKLQGDDIKLINEGSETKLYKIEGLLITNSKQKSQSEVLSDIRSLTGITIVNNKDYQSSSPKKGYQYTYTTIKIDPYPYLKNGNFDIETIKSIIEDIKNIKGVVTYKAEPKLINIGI